MTASRAGQAVKSIRALARGLNVLELIQASAGTSLRDLHRETNLPKATILRILRTLQDEGFVWQRVVDNAYMPSYSLQENARHLDDVTHLVEVASPILVALTRKVDWPSILAVPRLDFMEVIETNRPRSYFHHIPLGPIGFQVNMAMSATGRAYLAFCPEKEREATLARLRLGSRQGSTLVQNKTLMDRLLTKTRNQGFGARDQRFGGHFDKPRSEFDDGRGSIAVPIVVNQRVPGVINLTWIRRVATERRIVEAHLTALQAAAAEIAAKLGDPKRPAARRRTR